MSTLFGCILALSLTLNGCTRRIVTTQHTYEIKPGSSSSESPSQNREVLYHLDLNKPSISQPIQREVDKPSEAKLVQVEVSEVQNPKKLALTFKVYYQPVNQEKIYLGSFSLYPADNPGRFIVATQGKVKDEGALILTMSTPDQTDNNEAVRVGVKRMTLVKRD